MALSSEQLDGLEEVLPAGYPRQGGLVVLLDNKKRSTSGRKRRRSTGKARCFVPWYKRASSWWEY